MVLTDAEQRELAQHYCERPTDVWVLLPAERRPLDVAFERDDWNPQQRAAQAMTALDYSGEIEVAEVMLGQRGDESVAKLDTGSAAHVLWKQVKSV